MAQLTVDLADLTLSETVGGGGRGAFCFTLFERLASASMSSSKGFLKGRSSRRCCAGWRGVAYSVANDQHSARTNVASARVRAVRDGVGVSFFYGRMEAHHLSAFTAHRHDVRGAVH